MSAELQKFITHGKTQRAIQDLLATNGDVQVGIMTREQLDPPELVSESMHKEIDQRAQQLNELAGRFTTVVYAGATALMATVDNCYIFSKTSA